MRPRIGWVTAKAIATSAVEPEVMNCFVPLTTQRLPWRTARVLIAAASEPASGRCDRSRRASFPGHRHQTAVLLLQAVAQYRHNAHGVMRAEDRRDRTVAGSELLKRQRIADVVSPGPADSGGTSTPMRPSFPIRRAPPAETAPRGPSPPNAASARCRRSRGPCRAEDLSWVVSSGHLGHPVIARPLVLCWLDLQQIGGEHSACKSRCLRFPRCPHALPFRSRVDAVAGFWQDSGGVEGSPDSFAFQQAVTSISIFSRSIRRPQNTAVSARRIAPEPARARHDAGPVVAVREVVPDSDDIGENSAGLGEDAFDIAEGLPFLLSRVLGDRHRGVVEAGLTGDERPVASTPARL